MDDGAVGRRITIDGMTYAPTNEQGVVFLFGRLAWRLGFDVEHVQTEFPDCIARRRGQSCRIEFEYRARQYLSHREEARPADIIVCWENDWDDRPRAFRRIEIIELKRYVDAAPRIFVVGANQKKWAAILDKSSCIEWTMLRNAQVGDLVLMYRTSPASAIKDVWKITDHVTFDKKASEYGAEMRVVTRLAKPLTFGELKTDPTTRNLAVVRQRFRGKADVTHDWPQLYASIIKHNPRAKAVLQDWCGE